VLGDGRVARTPWFAVAKDAVEQDFYLPRPTHTDSVGILHADDFNLPTTIARITVVQNLSHVQHNAPSSPAYARPNHNVSNYGTVGGRSGVFLGSAGAVAAPLVRSSHRRGFSIPILKQRRDDCSLRPVPGARYEVAETVGERVIRRARCADEIIFVRHLEEFRVRDRTC
jgi:hypothetical protein